jgi:hypothetical protein
MFSFSDDIFTKFKKEGNVYKATIDCIMLVGVRGVKVRAIKAAMGERLHRHKQQAHIVSSELAEKVANKYARVFLGRRTFGPLNKQEIEKFNHAAQKILLSSRRSGLEPDRILNELVSCLHSEFTVKGETVKIGSLHSDYTWNVLFPQHLKQVMPGYKEV